MPSEAVTLDDAHHLITQSVQECLSGRCDFLEDVVFLDSNNDVMDAKRIMQELAPAVGGMRVEHWEGLAGSSTNCCGQKQYSIFTISDDSILRILVKVDVRKETYLVSR